MKWLVAYDIGDPRRLRRVAHLFERHALRCQKSVFFFTGEEKDLDELLQQAESLIDPESDTVQAWRLAPAESSRGIHRGLAVSLCPAGVVIARKSLRTVERTNEPV